MEYLDLGDLLEIASQVLQIDAEVLGRTIRLNEADSAVHAPQASFGGVECHEGLARKIAVLGYRILKNHPLPDGNKRTAFLAMTEMAKRNDTRLVQLSEEPVSDMFKTLLAAAAGELDEEGFVAWVEERLQ